MTRLLTLGALAASLALAACGGSNDSSDSSAPAASGTTVAVKTIDGIGSVLVDAGGKALYTSDVEADGKIACTGACNSFWKPLTTDTAKPTASSDAGTVGVIKRPDGSMQVAVAGKPVYTFSEDSPGKVSGNGFTDDFAGKHFTWHAALAGGKSSSGGSSSGSQGGGSGDGYGGGSSGNYGY